MEKDELRKLLAEKVAGFEGDVKRYAPKSVPGRQPWKKKTTILDEDYQRALNEAEQRRDADDPGAD